MFLFLSQHPDSTRFAGCSSRRFQLLLALRFFSLPFAVTNIRKGGDLAEGSADQLGSDLLPHRSPVPKRLKRPEVSAVVINNRCEAEAHGVCVCLIGLEAVCV